MEKQIKRGWGKTNMKELYIAKVTDAEGKVWVFEGTVQGMPIYVAKGAKGANPKILTRAEAEDVQLKYVYEGETFSLEKIN